MGTVGGHRSPGGDLDRQDTGAAAEALQTAAELGTVAAAGQRLTQAQLVCPRILISVLLLALFGACILAQVLTLAAMLVSWAHCLPWFVGS